MSRVLPVRPKQDLPPRDEFSAPWCKVRDTNTGRHIFAKMAVWWFSMASNAYVICWTIISSTRLLAPVSELKLMLRGNLRDIVHDIRLHA